VNLRKIFPSLKQRLPVFITGGAGIVTILFLFSCANVVAPTGGPEDETPPELLRSTPQINAPNFVGDEVRLYFNEFVQLNNIDQKLLVSPPLPNKPQARLRGRSVILQWQDTLRANTTYNFFFGNAISDITEGNAIPNFQVVFSTGPFVDSLSLSGVVTNAFSQKPEGEVYVMLYHPGNDSVPYKELPVYLAKTDKEGRFRIGNIATGTYMIFALNDLNANFLFDLPTERIAFLDSLVVPVWVDPALQPVDTVPLIENDPEQPAGTGARPARAATATQRTGTGVMNRQEEERIADTPLGNNNEIRVLNLELNMFLEPDTLQRLVSTSVPRKGFINLNFRVPFDSIVFRDLSETLPETWYISEPWAGGDTLHLWVLPPVPDSLFLEVSDRSLILDTIRIATQPRAVRPRPNETVPTPKTPVRLNTVQASLPYFSPLEIIADNPLSSFDTTLIFMMDADSVVVKPDFSLVAPLNRKLTLQTPLEQDKRYHFVMLPGALTDIFGYSNDTLRSTFSTTKHEDYGTLFLNIRFETGKGQLLLHLTDSQNRLVHEMLVPPGGVCIIPHLLPATYHIRLIHDMNKNGIWDTGHFMKRRQPEPVFVKPQTIQIRQNWDSEVNWVVSD